MCIRDRSYVLVLSSGTVTMQNGFQISRKSDYALRAMIYLARQTDDVPVSFRQIALAECISEDYLAKILRSLVISGLVSSVRGSKGGYFLTNLPQEISFLNVIEAVDGPLMINVCLGEAVHECPVQLRCSLYGVWKKAQDAMINVFREISLEDVLLQNLKPTEATNKLGANS